MDSAPGQGTRITGTVPVVAAPSSGTVVAGQQGHEHLGVRAARPVTGSQPGPVWWPVMVCEENTTVLLPVVTSRNAWW